MAVVDCSALCRGGISFGISWRQWPLTHMEVSAEHIVYYMSYDFRLLITVLSVALSAVELELDEFCV